MFVHIQFLHVFHCADSQITGSIIYKMAASKKDYCVKNVLMETMQEYYNVQNAVYIHSAVQQLHNFVYFSVYHSMATNVRLI